jgi:hypothetical protein
MKRRKTSHQKPTARKNERVKKIKTPKKTPWGDNDAKHRAFLAIMRDIIADPGLGRKYLKSDVEAADAFRKKGLDVPSDVKVVFLPAGDSDKGFAGSTVIELPRVDPNSPSPTDDELTELYLIQYHINW